MKFTTTKLLIICLLLIGGGNLNAQEEGGATIEQNTFSIIHNEGQENQYELVYTITSEEPKECSLTEFKPTMLSEESAADHAAIELELSSKIYNNDVEYTLTSIGNEVFARRNITGALTIPNTVKSIGSYSFTACPITSLTFEDTEENPSKLEVIDSHAFHLCSKIEGELIIPNTVKIIENGAFDMGYFEIYDPETYDVCRISALIFEEDSQLEKIGDNAFAYCNSMKGDLIIPKNVVTIGSSAFVHCSKPCPEYCEEGCEHVSGFASLSFEEGSKLETIGSEAFFWSEQYRGDLIIPNSVTSIGVSAFAQTSFDGELKISENVTIIEESTFRMMERLTGVVTIPKKVTSIGKEAFCWATMTGLIFEDDSALETIGIRAFANCNMEGNLTIPSNVETIGNYAFSYCNMVENFILPEGLLTIGDRAFETTAVTAMTIPSTVTTIGKALFADCNYLETVVVDENNKVYDSRDNCNAIVETATNTIIAGCPYTTIPETVTAIGDYAFCQVSLNAEILDIQSNIASIGEYAFYDVKGIYEIYIPSSVTEIKKKAFSGCEGVTKVIIDSENPKYDSRENCNAIIETATNTLINGFSTTTVLNGIETIEEYAFESQRDMREMKLPYTVTTIKNGAFRRCDGLKSFHIPASVVNMEGNPFEETELHEVYCYWEEPIGDFYGSIGFSYEVEPKLYCPSISLDKYRNYEGSYIDASMLVGMPTYTEEGWYDADGTFSPGFVPSMAEDHHVAINAEYVLNQGEMLECTSLGMMKDGGVTIKEGGQLYSNDIFGNITTERIVKGHGQDLSEATDENGVALEKGWYAISSAHDKYAVSNMMSDENAPEYELFRYDETTSYWQNVKNEEHTDFSFLEYGRGYLYANKDDITVTTTGNVNAANVTYDMSASGDYLTGFNLIGNPFTHDIYMGKALPTTLDNSVVFELYDMYDDGWSGNYLKVTYGSNEEKLEFTSEDWSQGYKSVTMSFDPGTEVTVEFVADGDYPEECSYSMSYAYGEYIHGYSYQETSYPEEDPEYPEDPEEYEGMERSESSDGSDEENTEEYPEETGNPFTFTVVEEQNLLNEAYYTLSGEGAWVVNQLTEMKPVAPGQAVLVKAFNEIPVTIINTNEKPQQETRSSKNQMLVVSVANEKYNDKAYVSFGEGVGLDKISHQNVNIPMLYVHAEDADYALAVMDKNVKEIPLNFEAKTMGQYTISLRQENCEFDELYLVDKQMNEIVDILKDDYTFMATTNDNPERFVLTMDIESDGDTDNVKFLVYVDADDMLNINGITGTAMINIFDAQGRYAYRTECHDENCRVPASAFTAGVYIIQKIDDNGVETQKIIID